MRTAVVSVLFALWLIGGVALPQLADGQKPPTLTTEQRQALVILSQRIEIAQLRAQQAQQEFDKARDEIQKLVVSLQVAGWDLDLAKGEYVKKPEKKPGEGK